jgi:phospholipid transport system substrate-binding protein
MVKVESENIESSKAVVKTVVLSKGDTFPIDYKLMLENGQWRVYDVVIENIGLVANYRNEFSGIIRKDKFPGLMERLRKKVE